MAGETPADKLKREQAEKAEQDRLDADKERLAKEAADQEEALKRDAEILAKRDAEKAAKEPVDEPMERLGFTSDDSEAAARHLRTIGLAYPLTTPDEHVIFGFAGMKFSLGQLRALFNLKRS